MFIEDPEGDLRQGDICELRALPIWNLKTTKQLTEDGGGDVVKVEIVPFRKDMCRGPGGGVLVAIASQCCDLAPGKRTGVLVAPVRRPPFGGTKPDVNDEVRGSYERNADGAYAHLGLFPIELPSDPGQLYNIDTSMMTSLMPSVDAIDLLQRSRLLQMVDDKRNQFRIKLGRFMARPPDTAVET